MENYFALLNNLDCSEKIEKKNGMNYLSWAFAWGELKKLFPNAIYTVYENKDGYNYHTDGKTCWVKTGVTVEGIEHIEYLPVMDFRNKSILFSAVSSFDVNKSIQRSLTKAVARHGLGLYIYAGEDLPEEETKESTPKSTTLSDKQIQRAFAVAKESNLDKGAIDKWIKGKYNKDSIKDLTVKEYDALIEALKNAKEK